MSTTKIRLIPAEPISMFTAEEEHIINNYLDKSGSFLANYRFYRSGNVEFVDQGENFDQLICPFCQTSLDLDWWQRTMDEAFSKHFNNLYIVLPCCMKVSSLSDLYYQWPAGFACCYIEFDEIEASLLIRIVGELFSILNRSFKIIYSRY